MEVLRRETDYALRALLVLAEEPRSLLSTSTLSRRCGVTLEHIRKIMPKLAKARIVKAVRGSKGGFRLARKASGVTLADVVAAIQGPLVLNLCVLGSGCCDYYARCRMTPWIVELQQKLDRLVSQTTLEDLMEQNAALQTAGGRTKRFGSPYEPPAEGEACTSE